MQIKNRNGLLRLCNLAILSNENEVARKSIDYTDIADDFAPEESEKCCYFSLFDIFD